MVKYQTFEFIQIPIYTFKFPSRVVKIQDSTGVIQINRLLQLKRNDTLRTLISHTFHCAATGMKPSQECQSKST